MNTNLIGNLLCVTELDNELNTASRVLSMSLSE
jgi:hypothetical protein